MTARVRVTRAVFPRVVEALSRKFEVEHHAADQPWTVEELVAAATKRGIRVTDTPGVLEGREPPNPVN